MVPPVDEYVQHIVQLARQVEGEGFNDLQEEEVQEELHGHAGEELTEEELAELVKKQRREDEEEEQEEVNFKRGMEQLLIPYKEILKEPKCKVAHPPISVFFLPSSTPSTTPSTPARKPQPPVRVPPPPDSDSDMDNPPPAAPSSDHSPLPPLPKQMRRTSYLQQLVAAGEIEDAKDDEVQDAKPREFPTSLLSSILREVDKQLQLLEDNDYNAERSRIAVRGVKSFLAPYEQLLCERRKTAKQKTLDVFFKSTPKKQTEDTEPQPSTSGIKTFFSSLPCNQNCT
ncbi:hypothetical protein Hamer_G004244 [Homarus americanus]|uniref:Uncharacterized protein n=1 Tax=Homarus americanus TaxID=6706 RepID=A0A8J5MQ55_HOMAM|nr:hypothetical protein Hamer_G004244 [Homarus americanus]